MCLTRLRSRDMQFGGVQEEGGQQVADFKLWNNNIIRIIYFFQNAALVEGTDMRANWEKTPIAVEFRIYLFNVTNPEEVHKGAKPIVQEVGPFCYDEWKEKVGFSDNPEEDEVSFHMKNTWIFNKDCYGNTEEAGLTGEEMITVPNAALLVLRVSMKYINIDYKN
ncbi:sensory neuron membrane protein 1-like [Nilaparvata lugens]|uniref:sensory neuron membrane protein 1-like n=1 Tax=Nilaparvata lugens TaxID=108931 RepID=UPI00193E649A|nr:sensory neuron membrane protein 1-like [Nilaparvata lugens]